MIRWKRQGCPLSALLFLFVADILVTKLETNETIIGIRINDYEIIRLASLYIFSNNHNSRFRISKHVFKIFIFHSK